MPLWCSSSDSSKTSDGAPSPHHRIVRVPPGEAVVLNSAERAPYLLYIEILKDDLNFDPAKRSNKEILRKVITKDGGKKHGWTDSAIPSSLFSVSTPRAGVEGDVRTPFTTMTQTTFLNGPPTASSPRSTFSNDDEEIDLVEQLYGSEQPLRSKMPDIEDSIVLPSSLKNKELDMVAWSRTPPMLPSDDSRFLQRSQSHSRASSISRELSLAPSAPIVPPGGSELLQPLSLDEYSERMRTAAIMLAQLNADQVRDPASFPHKVNGSPRPETMERSRKPFPPEY